MESPEQLKLHIERLIWLIEVEHKIDGQHLTANAKKAIQDDAITKDGVTVLLDDHIYCVNISNKVGSTQTRYVELVEIPKHWYSTQALAEAEVNHG